MSALVSATRGGGDTVDWVTNAMAVMLAAVVPFAIAREIWRHPKVTPETVMGALCIYLLIGMMFALGFAIIADASDEPYFVQTDHPTAADYVYFSYVTMATVGYGDLTARSSIGRMSAAFEGLARPALPGDRGGAARQQPRPERSFAQARRSRRRLGLTTRPRSRASAGPPTARRPTARGRRPG